MSSQRSLEKYLFNIKFGAKRLIQLSKKSKKRQQAEKQKCLNCIRKNRPEEAKIHAENSIREGNEATNYLRLSSRLDGVAGRVQSAIIQNKVTHNMKAIVFNMDRAVNGMDLNKVAEVMMAFERTFENMDVTAAAVQETMESTTTTSMPRNQVDSLLQQIADEAGLELRSELPSTREMPSLGENSSELTQRLAQLRSENRTK